MVIHIFRSYVNYRRVTLAVQFVAAETPRICGRLQQYQLATVRRKKWGHLIINLASGQVKYTIVELGSCHSVNIQ